MSPFFEEAMKPRDGLEWRGECTHPKACFSPRTHRYKSWRESLAPLYQSNHLPREWQYYFPRWVKKFWPTVELKRANLACGRDYREGWVNVDKFAPKADVRADLFKLPWDVESNQFDFVYASHFIEHVPPRFKEGGEDALILMLGEVARILKPGGLFMARTPFGVKGLGTVTHYRYFNLDSFNWTAMPSATRDEAGGDGFPLRLVKAGIGERHVRFTRKFDSTYHFPKYFNVRGSFGVAKEVIFVMEKTG